MTPSLPRSSEQASFQAWVPSENIRRLQAGHNACAPAVGAERAVHYTEVHKKYRKQCRSAPLLNAHCLADHLARRSIRVYDGELIVGSHTEHRIGAICHVEKAGLVMLEDLFRFERRKTNPLQIGPQVRRDLMWKVIPYWLGRTLPMKAFGFREKLRFAREQLNATYFVINESGGIAHFLPDYAELIRTGSNGLRERIYRRRARGARPSPAQTDFLDAGLVVLDGLDGFAARYRELARQANDAALVETLEQVPQKPARNLREALQLIWFFQLAIQIESLDQGISLGRMDQYLYPLYLRERAQADFDPNRIKDLFAAFFLKLSEVIPLFSERATQMYAGLPSGQALTLGGVDANGNDASNELTFLLLDVLDGFKTRQPNWHARLSRASRPEYVKRVMAVLASGGGSPALYNDDAIIPAMVERGVDAGKALNYATVGCVEPALPGESFTSSDAALFNLPICLERVLGTGARNKSLLRRIGSMPALLEALESEMSQRLGYLKHCLDHIERSNARYFPTPLSSMTVRGCIESAADLSAGGAAYNASGIQGVGVADLANSLAVIEQLVFERKTHTLEDIAIACAGNYAGNELLRAQALKVNKFGNDRQSVDELAAQVTAMFDRNVSRHVNTRGGRWMPGYYSMTCHQGFGRRTGALPSGRRAGEPLADGLAPVDGTDCLGPTASLNSVAKLDHSRFGNGINLNIKFDARTLSAANGGAILESLAKGYFSQGGMQVQINVLDIGELEDAMRHPERHKNLLVRISGYCAYFVDLTPEMQREIIARTAQRV